MKDLKSANRNLPIIFFDGFCILCNGFVDFIFRRDKKHTFYFAPLQGKTARSVLEPDCIDALESIVYVDETGCYQRSNAVLKILTRLSGVYKVFGVLRIVPRFIRDAFYDFIGRNRYRWFGKRQACRIPTAEDRGRILE